AESPASSGGVRLSPRVAGPTSERSQMTTAAIIHHRVADFDAWKAVYDGFEGAQRENGVRSHVVWRAEGDPELVVVLHTFDSSAAAHAFFELPVLREAMSSAGVDESSLRVEFLDEVASGSL